MNTDLDKTIALTFKKLLQRYVKELRTDTKEIADGLDLSRPTVQNFLDADDDRLKLPDKISRSRLDTLWRELTKPEKLDPKNPGKRYRREADELETRSMEEVRYEAIENRKLLKERGPDELMIAAGFLPVKMKWIGVSPERYPQMMQMASLLKNPILEFDSFMRVTQGELESIIKAVDKEVELKRSFTEVEPKNSPTKQIQKGLVEDPTLDPELRDTLYKKIDKACSRILGESHRERLSVEEALGLFSTILSNELNQQERLNLKFRVLYFDLQHLSINLFDQLTSSCVKNAFEEIGIDAEQELHTIASSSSKDKDEDREYFLSPVVKVGITCSYFPQNISKDNIKARENITFSYISCSTALNLAAKAVALHLGFKEAIRSPEVSTEKFGNKMASLVKCTATLQCDENGSYVQGDWVDRDFLKTYVQSLLIAGEKWLFFQVKHGGLDPEKYLEIFQNISLLDKKLSESRSSFHSYQFSKDSTTSKKLEQIANDTHAFLEKHRKVMSVCKSLETFKVNLSRIYLLAKIHQLRLVNMQGNLSTARKLVADINRCFAEEEIEDVLCPIVMLFKTEQKLYQLSSGSDEKLFDGGTDFWEDWLVKAKSSIDRYLFTKASLSTPNPDYPSDPDVDVYQSLGTIHSIAGRWLFYLGQSEYELQLAYQYFLKAAHYFSRIGLVHRVSRCLAIAGRAQVRMKNYELADQLREDAYGLLRKHLHEGQRDAFIQSILSEIYLLEAEYELHAKSDYLKGLELSLRGLKGAMWLGLARRTSDNLHNIWQCAQYLGDKNVEPLLKKVFPILWTSEDLQTIKEKRERLNPLENRIAEDVSARLAEIKKRAHDQTWSQVAHQFQKMSSNIWHQWYRESADDLSGQHPIGKLIDDDEFLKPVS